MNRVSRNFSLVKSVFNRIPNLLFFCLRKVNKNKRRGSQIVSARVDRTKDKILKWLIVYQFSIPIGCCSHLFLRADSSWFPLDFCITWITELCFAVDSVQHYILYYFISFLFKSKILPRIGSFPFR